MVMDESTIDSILDRATDAMAQGKFREAFGFVRPLTKKDNSRAVRGAAYAILGRCRYTQDKYYSAIRLLRKARSFGNAAPTTFITLGKAYEASATKPRWFRRESNLELARQTFALGQTEHADNELISIMYARYALEQHQWRRAIDALAPHVAASRNPYLFSIYSTSLRRVGRVKEANSFLLQGLATAATADTLLGVAAHHVNNGEFSAAHSMLVVCSDKFPESTGSQLFIALDTAISLGDMLFGLLPEFKTAAEKRFAKIADLENRVAETQSLTELNFLYKEINDYVTGAMATVKARIDELSASHLRQLANLRTPSDTPEETLQEPSPAEQTLLAIRKFNEYLPVIGAVETFSAIDQLTKTADDLRKQFARRFKFWRFKAYSTGTALLLLQLISLLAFVDSLVGVFVSGGIVVAYVQDLFPRSFSRLVAVVSGLFWIFFVVFCGVLRKRILKTTVEDLRIALTELVTNYGPVLTAAEMDLAQFEAALPLPDHTQSAESLIEYALDSKRLPVYRCHAFFLWFQSADSKSARANIESYQRALKQPVTDMRLMDYFSLFATAVGGTIDVAAFLKSYREGGEWSAKRSNGLRLSVAQLPEKERDKDRDKWRSAALKALQMRGAPDSIEIIQRLWDKDDELMENMQLAEMLKDWPTEDGVLALVDLVASDEERAEFGLLAGAQLGGQAIDKLVAFAEDAYRFVPDRSEILHVLLSSSNPAAVAAGRELMSNLPDYNLHALARLLLIHNQKDVLYAFAADESLHAFQKIPLTAVLAEEEGGACEELVLAIADEPGVPEKLEHMTRRYYFEALGSVGSASTLTLLTDNLDASDELIRHAALRGLARAGDGGYSKLGEFLKTGSDIPRDVEADVRLALIVLQPNATPDWVLLREALGKNKMQAFHIARQVCELVEQAVYFGEERYLADRLFEFLEALESDPEFDESSAFIRRAREDTDHQIKMRRALGMQKAPRFE